MSIFSKIKLPRPKRTMHNLSYASKMSLDFGKLVPIMCEKVIPGDKFYHGHEFLMRFAPFVNQVFQGFQTRVDYFFVPSRLLWSNFENFLSKGVNGETVYVHPFIDLKQIYDGEQQFENTLLDYFNLPTSNVSGHAIDGSGVYGSLQIDALPFYAMFKVLIDYYFDENLYPSINGQDVVELLLNKSVTDFVLDGDNTLNLQMFLQMFHEIQGEEYSSESTPSWSELLQPFKRAYPKDYFTSALPFAQRGPLVQIPLNGEGDVRVYGTHRGTGRTDYSGVGVDAPQPSPGYVGDVEVTLYQYGSPLAKSDQVYLTNPAGQNTAAYAGGMATTSSTSAQAAASAAITSDTLTFKAVNINGTATITDLRTAQVVQSWLEKNARAGVRYKEQLASHFGVRSRDYRLDRAELLGSYKSTIQIGETFTTAANSDGTFIPGMGVSNATGSQAVKPWKHTFDEHGYVIGFVSVFPSAAYSQGIPRQFMELDVFDYYWPEFQHIGEQEISRLELGIEDGGGVDTNLFGYTPRYAQYKTRPNQVHGDFRNSLKFMTASREFSKLPLLNNNFVNVDVDYNNLYRVFNADTELANSSPVYLDFFHNFKALRPMSYFGSPRII